MKNPGQEYEKRIRSYQSAVQTENRMINLISTLRLVTFVGGLGAAVYLYLNKYYYGSAIIGCVFLILFLVLVLLHQHYMDKRKYSTALLTININSQKRLNGEWREFQDTGEEFIDDEHNFSSDLDIFGRGSIFQWINNAVTFQGRHSLKRLLLIRPSSSGEVLRKQQAIDELAEKVDFRQRLTAEAMISLEKGMDNKELISWAAERNEFYCSSMARVIFRLLPVITILLFIVHFITNKVPVFIPGTLLAIQTLMIWVNSRKRGYILGILRKYLDSIKSYSGMLDIVEGESFKSDYINGLKNNLKNSFGNSAHEQVKRLDSINSAIANRSYMLYIIFDIVFLLDYQFIISLELWKKYSGDHIKIWIDTLGDMEALCSLSNIRYDNPGWSFPQVSEGKPSFSAQSMGHPLLGGCVTNDLQFRGSVDVLLITGSNMSGKSTLLRTAGINLVLAYTGAPVYANRFACTLMDIYTCMRIRDDLERSISSFYAELLKIKKIVEAVKEGKPVFFLLDEIFKGTNSIDRHTGAKVLINKLSRGKVLGLVSTHDLELGSLENENMMVKNYHFQESYKNNEICFDYRVYPGVSTTRNALHLMKLAGIDGEE